MRILLLGGTVFLSHAVAAEAVARGHDVTCASRGQSGDVPDSARQVRWDRGEEPHTELAAEEFDAVVDVARLPSQVRRSVLVWPTAHWVFVSTINVYAEETPGGGPETLPLHDPIENDADEDQEPSAYGPMKVACEQIVDSGTASSTIVRPGLIVGPGDPTGRFTYWPWRLAEADGEEVLAPGVPDDVVQVIDVRDLAAWLVDLAERRVAGVFDGVGEPTAISELLGEVASGLGVRPDFAWVDQEFLTAHNVQPWMGPRSVPLWLPRPEYDGMLAHDAAAPRAAGLQSRPIADTARDTLTWVRADPSAEVTGLSRTEERELLDAWHAD